MKDELAWHRIPNHVLPRIENKPTRITVGDWNACVVKHGEVFEAINDRCPHAGASLSEGFLQDGVIACPLHNFKFKLSNGENISGQKYNVKKLPIESREDGWYIGVPKPSGWLF